MTTIKSFFSLEWWLTVGIALVFLSFVQDLVRRGVYALIGKFTSHVRLRSTKQIEKFASETLGLAESPIRHGMAVREEIRFRLRGIYFTLGGLFTATLAGSVAVAQANPLVMASLDWPFPHHDIPHASTYMMVGAVVNLLIGSAE